MAANDNFEMKVMMLGGQRTGKTSILASMKSNFEERFKNTGLQIVSGDIETLDELDEANAKMRDYFNIKDSCFPANAVPTSDDVEYSFSISIANKKGKINVKFYDFPGEWLRGKEYKEKKEKLIEEIKKNHVLILAIDTPCMMEENGSFNGKQNRCFVITEMIKMAFGDIDRESGLVLFVPLKCERYYNEGKMEAVCKKTVESYKELIQYFADSKPKFEVAVTPIFTLGGVAFHRFQRGKDQKIEVNEQTGCPKEMYYIPDRTVKQPIPKYCEQPAVYLLAYLLQLASENIQENYKKGHFWDKLMIRLQENFFHMSSAKDYMEKKTCILNKLKKNGDGYKILQNPMKF